MGKKGKSIEQVQDQILNQFAHTNRAYQRKDRELTISEKLILEIPKRRIELEKRRKEQESKPRISFYQPNNILNRIKHMEKEEGEKVLKAYLKEQKQLNKSTNTTK